MAKINKIKAREILDSRGVPTVEVDLETEKGIFRASVPSGTSTGKNEALELRDGEKRYSGKGVLKAVKNVNEVIAPEIKEKEIKSQNKIDEILINLDGTENKSNLGANAILAVSMAFCRALAKENELSLYRYISQVFEAQPKLPTPCFLMIEGGKHAGNILDIQEFMIVPAGKSFGEKVQKGVEVYQALGDVLRKSYGEFATNIGLEGGYAAPLGSSDEALSLIMQAAEQAGYVDDIKIIIDAAASSFYSNGIYAFEGATFTRKGMFNFYSEIIKKYPISAIEDPFDEEDWKSFQDITKKFGKKVTIIGDDLLVTNPDRIKKAIKEKYCNGLIIKPNQIGTVSETMLAAKLALQNKWKVFVKHRSGETCDSFIADLVVGFGNGWIMAGAPNRGERIAKYNRLLRIEEDNL